MLESQLLGNYGMLEVYVELLAGGFLFFASLAAILMSLSYGRVMRDRVHLIGDSIGPGGVKLAERGVPGWQYISTGIFFTGLIGVGEVMEHFFEAPVAIIFYNYLTIMSPPAALYFFYIGIKKHLSKELEGAVMVRFLLVGIIFYIIVGGLSLATEYYSAEIKKFYLYFIVLPILIFSAVVFKTAFQAYEKYLLFMPTVSAMVLSTTFLALFTLASELSIVLGYPTIYILSQAIKDILVCVAGTSILAYGGAIRMMKIRRM